MIESTSSNLTQQLKAQITELTIQNKALKLAKDEAEKIAQKYYSFWNFSPNGLYLIDCSSKVILLNDGGLTLLGKTRDDLIDFTFRQFITKKDLPDFNTFLLKAKKNNAENFCDIELTLPKGKHASVHVTAKFFEKEQQYLIIITDRNEKEYFRKKLLENEFIVKETQRMGHIGSFKYSISNNLKEMSKELYLIFGVSQDMSLTTESWLNTIHPEDREMVNHHLQECIVNYIPFHKEFRIIRMDNGAVKWLVGWGEIIFDDKANKLSMIGIIQDITERKLAQEKIQSAEKRSHQIFESSKEGILILDAITGQITDANPFLIELIGFNYDELVGKELWKIGVFKNIATSKETFIELQNKEYIRFEDMPLETKAGNLIDVEFVSNVYMVDTHKVIQCHIRDISDRKKADKVLKESAQLYYAMFEKNQTPQLLIHPIHGNIIDVNLAASLFYGYSVEEFKLKTLSDISTLPSEQILEQMKKYTLTGPSHFEFVHQLASGETCDIEIYTSPLYINGEDLLISTINNISKRKQEEERLVQLNNNLKEVNILKSQFISTVSHEFRTPLAGILSSAQLLQIYDDPSHKEKKEKLFKQIFDAVQHTKALLDDVSLIDKEQTSESFFRPTNIELLPLINEIIEENLNVSETNQKVILTSKIDLKSYYMDAIMIRHILNNILSNALKYSTKDVTIDLSKTKKQEVKFTIKDQGIGIPEDEIKYLLEPYYRASNKGPAKGTGFGLSIVKRFVDLHKGQLLIESVVEKGTTVIIILPY